MERKFNKGDIVQHFKRKNDRGTIKRRTKFIFI